MKYRLKKNVINSFIEYYTLLAQNSSLKVMKNCLFITHKILLACRTHSECFIRFGWSESLADNFTSKVDICTNVYPYQGQPSSVANFGLFGNFCYFVQRDIGYQMVTNTFS